MKIRNGFVSNSSSSSFIIRGAKLSKDELIKTLNISQEEIDKYKDDYDFYYYILYKKLKSDGLSVEPDGNYFGEKTYETLIVGQSLGGLEDGDVRELLDRTPEEDYELLKKFENLGFKDMKLSTYIQMVSNDNY
jgi:hypothetical protein